MTSYVAFMLISSSFIVNLLFPLIFCIAIESTYTLDIYLCFTSTFEGQKQFSLALAKTTQRSHCLDLVEYKWHPNDRMFYQPNSNTKMDKWTLEELTSGYVGNAKKGKGALDTADQFIRLLFFSFFFFPFSFFFIYSHIGS